MSPEGGSTRDRIRGAITSQKRSTVTVLSSLLTAQDAVGYLPDEAIEEVAIFADTTINNVWGVASFYGNFRFSPPAKHVVEVCWGPSCHLGGAQHILKGLQDDLGISGEGTSAEKDVTLRGNTCLGACSQGPVISLDHRLVGGLDAESARRMVADLTNGTS